ncbi:MAG: bifunctional diguanylate cyclase/phosphodiesterase [Pseudomonadota bacterium]
MAQAVLGDDQLAGLVRSLPIAATIVRRDTSGTIRVVASNAVFEMLYGILSSQCEIPGFIVEEELLDRMMQQLEQGGVQLSERWSRPDPVDPREIDVSLARLGAVEDKSYYLASFIDRTTEMQNQRNLHREMLSDSLTGIYNRTGFEEAILDVLSDDAVHEMSDKTAKGANYAVIAIDLSRFSQVNEYAGAIVGDELILTVASRLKNMLRNRDILARTGGDEFGIFVHLGENSDDIDTICARLQSVFESPYSLSGLEVKMEAAIGVGLGTVGEDDPSDTIRQAQFALKQAKRSNNVELYRKEVLDISRHRFSLETDLRRALQNDALSLAYQPLIDLSTGDVIGFEALARWNDPDRGIIAPTDFIPVAEDCGLIVPLGRWALSTAARTLSRWDKVAGRTLGTRVGVNLSAVQFTRDDVASAVDDAIRNAAIVGNRLTLELTESAILSDPDRAAQAMESLKALDTCLAMDDFGTGYSNLAYLQRLPIDILKIDRSFVTEMLSDRDRVSIVRAVLSLANALGMETTAEGVETLELSNTLAALGCSHGQGYYYAKPLTADEALDFYLQRTKTGKA